MGGATRRSRHVHPCSEVHGSVAGSVVMSTCEYGVILFHGHSLTLPEMTRAALGVALRRSGPKLGPS